MRCFLLSMKLAQFTIIDIIFIIFQVDY